MVWLRRIYVVLRFKYRTLNEEFSWNSYIVDLQDDTRLRLRPVRTVFRHQCLLQVSSTLSFVPKGYMFIFDITTYHGGFAMDDENFRMHFQLDNGPSPNIGRIG